MNSHILAEKLPRYGHLALNCNCSPVYEVILAHTRMSCRQSAIFTIYLWVLPLCANILEQISYCAFILMCNYPHVYFSHVHFTLAQISGHQSQSTYFVNVDSLLILNKTWITKVLWNHFQVYYALSFQGNMDTHQFSHSVNKCTTLLCWSHSVCSTDRLQVQYWCLYDTYTYHISYQIGT